MADLREVTERLRVSVALARLNDTEVVVSPDTLTALLDVADAARRYVATEVLVRIRVRNYDATSGDATDLGRSRRHLSEALARLDEVTA